MTAIKVVPARFITTRLVHRFGQTKPLLRLGQGLSKLHEIAGLYRHMVSFAPLTEYQFPLLVAHLHRHVQHARILVSLAIQGRWVPLLFSSYWFERFTGGEYRAAPHSIYPSACTTFVGYASEWVQDCWHGSYKGAPADGPTWLAEDCEERAARGGNYRLLATAVRVTQRRLFLQATRQPSIGFRVARDL